MNAIERTTTTFVAADEKIRPCGDRIIVKPLDDNLSESIIAIREGRPIRGKVLAAGAGAYRKRYNKDRSRVYETNDYIPMSVKIGDVVSWGGLNIFDGQGYSFEEITWGSDKCLVITERDVCFVEHA